MARAGINAEDALTRSAAAAGALTRSGAAADAQRQHPGSHSGICQSARLTAPSGTVRQTHSAICHSQPATQRPLSQSARHTAPSVTVRQSHSALYTVRQSLVQRSYVSASQTSTT